MIISRSKLSLLITTVGIISVLGLPVPDEDDLSASLSIEAIDVLQSRASQAGSISKRMDPNQRLPPLLEPKVHENLGPPPDPWRPQSLHSLNTQVSENSEIRQHPTKPFCLEPPVKTGPDPQPWGKSRPTNARVAEENQQQPSQDVPPQVVGPVILGPGGRYFRRVQGHKKGASVDAKMKFIKQILRDHSEDSYPCALVEHLLAPLEKSQKSHKKFNEKQVLLLNEYYILAQLVKTDEFMKKVFGQYLTLTGFSDLYH
ncbi:hypothetical protein FB446DRAFT_847241 [Lentinula raphanica]|nr:hypothetical protein FB446DRAFT_847241 [Lentinula raphanica]